MKHAGTEVLDTLEGVLRRMRSIDGLKEETRGAFYLRGKAFLHFHEDPAGLFADLRAGSEWQRLPVNTRTERTTLLARVKEILRTPV